MQPNRGRGKIISRLESVTGRSINELVEEAAIFGSLWDYSRALCREYHLKSSSSVARSLRRFVQTKKDREWYKQFFLKGRGILQATAVYLGVSAQQVAAHIVEHDLDITAIAKDINPENPDRVYDYLYSRVGLYRRNLEKTPKNSQ